MAALELHTRPATEFTNNTSLVRNSTQGLAISGVSGRLGEKLRQLDKDGNGVLDANELTTAVEELVLSETRARQWRVSGFALIAIIFLLSGALAGVTWGIINETKETKVQSNYLYASDASASMGPVVTVNYQKLDYTGFGWVLSVPSDYLSSLMFVRVNVTAGELASRVTGVMRSLNQPPTAVIVTDDAIVSVNSTAWSVTITNPALRKQLATFENTGSSPGRHLLQGCDGCGCGCGGGSGGEGYSSKA